MHHKRNDLSRGCAGRAIHRLCIARSNNGLAQVCTDIMKKAGIPEDLMNTMKEVLGVAESRALANSARKATIKGKKLRKEAKAKRSQRDAPVAGDKGSYGAGCAFQDDDLMGDTATGGDSAPPAKKPRLCSVCKQPGHSKPKCPQNTPPPAVPAAAPAQA
jgi:hypothetical protein